MAYIQAAADNISKRLPVLLAESVVAMDATDNTTQHPLPDPSVGSANPSASFPALWAYIEPALDHIMRSPTSTSSKAPAVATNYHIGIHTAVYNYFASQSSPSAEVQRAANAPESITGFDLYRQLDCYFKGVCTELLLGVPEEDDKLIYYLVPAFSRYSAGAQSVHNLLNYVNRSFVVRAVQEHKGWYHLSNKFDTVVKSLILKDTGVTIADIWSKVREIELQKWVLKKAESAEQIARAEASAEAASALDCIIPINSAAHRRFRIEVLEHLLQPSTPKRGRKKNTRGNKKILNAMESPLIGQQGRLGRAIHLLELTEGQGLDEERRKMAMDLEGGLGVSGVKLDHFIRQRLRKFGRSKSSALKQ